MTAELGGGAHISLRPGSALHTHSSRQGEAAACRPGGGTAGLPQQAARPRRGGHQPGAGAGTLRSRAVGVPARARDIARARPAPSQQIAPQLPVPSLALTQEPQVCVCVGGWPAEKGELRQARQGEAAAEAEEPGEGQDQDRDRAKEKARSGSRMLILLPLWLLLPELLPAYKVPAHKVSALTFLRVEQDKDKECSLECTGSPQKSLCASDGRTFLSRCEFQRAKCKDPQLDIAYRGNCKDVSRCVAERKYTQEQARKEFQQVFIPECNDDGTYSQVQCHSYTGYCWCVSPNGRPIGGTAVAHKTPRCSGSLSEKLPQREGTGKADEVSAPALESPPQGDEEDIASRYPTLWTEQVKSRQNKTNKNSAAASCDQELQSALEEAKQPQKDNVFIPECASGGLYKPVQCHPSTGYCWCVLVDTGRPIPGTSTRYEQPKCDNSARAHPSKTKDLFKGRQLQGCPGAKKNEFLTSVLDALSTDMVHAVSDPSASSSRLSEPDPNHTLEERVVHWYFKQLDKNGSGDIGKKEIKPFKRFLRKKSKPKKCVKKFVEYCDVNNDKSLTVPELMGCLGVTKEDNKADTKKRHTPKHNAESTPSNRQQTSRKQG